MSAEAFTAGEIATARRRSSWKSKYSINECSEKPIARASLLQRALAPSLQARYKDQFESRAEFEGAGVEEYRRVFGHSITTRHWRRLFKRTIDRDGGAKNWARLEIYLDESPPRKARSVVPFAFAAFKDLQEVIASFADPLAPTEDEKAYLWTYVFEAYERVLEKDSKAKKIKRQLIRFLAENASFLGRSEKGIKLQFERKLKRWIEGDRKPAAIADRRRQQSRPSVAEAFWRRGTRTDGESAPLRWWPHPGLARIEKTAASLAAAFRSTTPQPLRASRTCPVGFENCS